MSGPHTHVIAVVGPNASGKSALGIELASRLDGEIINCDSIQLYEGIREATGAIPVSAWQGIPHHLFGFVPPQRNYTAGDWADDARLTISQIESRYRRAVIVGGTGFYLRALVRPLFVTPRTDLALRERLNGMRQRFGIARLYRLLERVDPIEARRLFPADWPRIQRALEVFFQTGDQITHLRGKTARASVIMGRITVIALNPPRQELYDRINARVDSWFGSKLFSEVQSLLDAGITPESNVLKALGYRHMLGYLQGKWSRSEAIERMKIDTRRYAKRQLTWWRSWPDIKWVDGFGDDPSAVSDAEKHLPFN